MNVAGSYRRLTRVDVPGHDDDAVRLILEMGEAGWVGRVSSKGHVIMRAPAGDLTIAVSRNTYRNKRMANGRLQFQRWRDEQPSQEKQVSTTTQRWPCARCNKTFATEEFLNDHIHLDHEHMVRCPECDKWFGNNLRLGAHRANSHGYVSPTKAKRDARKARRAANPDHITVEEVVAKVKASFEPLPADDFVAEPDEVKPTTIEIEVPVIVQTEETTVLFGNVYPATHVMTSSDGQVMRVRVEEDSVFVADPSGACSIHTGSVSGWAHAGWTFEKLRPTYKQLITALPQSSLFLTVGNDGREITLWRRDHDDFVVPISTDYADLCRISTVDWTDCRRILHVGADIAD